MDISNEEQIKKSCLVIKGKLAPISILIITDACFIFKSLNATPEDWDRITSVNIRESSLITRYIIEQMEENESGGSIINFSSVSGFVG